MNARVLEHVAELLEYPTPGLMATVQAARRAAGSGMPALTAALDRFEAHVAGSSPSELEEVYTRTFDLQAPCCMDIGYQLFGENYARGMFLVRMRGEARAHGIDVGSELPDHLPVVLRLLAVLGPNEDPRGLVEEAILPATQKMVAAFGAKHSDSPYKVLLASLVEWLAVEFSLAVPVAPPTDQPPLEPPRRHLTVLEGGAR